jgi:hypothetical protein
MNIQWFVLSRLAIYLCLCTISCCCFLTLHEVQCWRRPLLVLLLNERGQKDEYLKYKVFHASIALKAVREVLRVSSIVKGHVGDSRIPSSTCVQ